MAVSEVTAMEEAFQIAEKLRGLVLTEGVQRATVELSEAEAWCAMALHWDVGEVANALRRRLLARSAAVAVSPISPRNVEQADVA